MTRSPIHRLASTLRAAGFTDAARGLPAAFLRGGLPLVRSDKRGRVRIVAEGEDLCAYLISQASGAPTLLATDQACGVDAPPVGRAPPGPSSRVQVTVRLKPDTLAALKRLAAREDQPWRATLDRIVASHLRVLGELSP